jgi:hypothetical protein
MPKPVTMTVIVEEFALGRVFRSLDGTPGVVTISLHGADPKIAHELGQRKKSQTVSIVVLGALIAGAERHQDLVSPVMAAGKSETSIYDSLYKLHKMRAITRKNGKFAITALGRKYYATASAEEKAMKEGEA